jgi:hypothetical protein
VGHDVDDEERDMSDIRIFSREKTPPAKDIFVD